MSHDPTSIRRVLVLGTGTLGQGIAQVAALAGYVTHLYDIDAGRIDKAIDAIKHVGIVGGHLDHHIASSPFMC